MSPRPYTPPEIWTESKGYRESLVKQRFVQDAWHWFAKALFHIEKTKRMIVQTCREWHTVATPLLYEHISVPNRTQFNRILRAFTRGDGKEREDCHHKRNHLVSRLDLFLANLVDATVPLIPTTPLLHRPTGVEARGRS